MNYFVVMPDGQQYGPADIATLNQWIAEGRLLATSMLQAEAGGLPVPASQVPGLNWPSPATSASQPMPPGNQYASAPTSAPGQFAAYPRSQAGGPLPEEVRRRYNWGAFTLNWIWGLNHKQYIPLLCFVPCIGFFVAIWCGSKGNEWAWESGRFSTVEEMEACQVVWAKWGVAIFCLSIALNVFATIVPMMAGVSSR